MKLRIFQTLVFFFMFFWGAILPTFTHADAPKHMPGITRYAFDLELYQGATGRFLDRFVDGEKADLLPWRKTLLVNENESSSARVKTQDIRELLFDEYGRAHFNQLPLSLQTQLKEGLTPPTQSILEKKENRFEAGPEKKILGLDGKPIDLSLKLGDPIVKKTRPEQPGLQTQSGLYLSEEQKASVELQREKAQIEKYYETLHQRWMKYAQENSEAALSMIPFQRLSPQVKEAVFRKSGKKSNFFVFKEPRDPLIEKLNIELDRSTIEVKVKDGEVIRDGKEFLKVLKDFCLSAGCHSAIQDPRGVTSAGIHYHFDFNQKIPEKELDQLMELYKLKNSVELLKSQSYSALSGYSNSAVLKRNGTRHWEIREATADPVTTLSELSDFFSSHEGEDPAEIVKRARQKIISSIGKIELGSDPFFVKSLLQSKVPAETAFDQLTLLTQNLKKVLPADHSLIAQVNRFADRLDEPWTKSFWDSVPETILTLEKGYSSQNQSFFKSLGRQKNWPESFRSRIPEIFKKSNFRTYEALLDIFMKRLQDIPEHSLVSTAVESRIINNLQAKTRAEIPVDQIEWLWNRMMNEQAPTVTMKTSFSLLVAGRGLERMDWSHFKDHPPLPKWMLEEVAKEFAEKRINALTLRNLVKEAPALIPRTEQFKLLMVSSLIGGDAKAPPTEEALQKLLYRWKGSEEDARGLFRQYTANLRRAKLAPVGVTWPSRPSKGAQVPPAWLKDEIHKLASQENSLPLISKLYEADPTLFLEKEYQDFFDQATHSVGENGIRGGSLNQAFEQLEQVPDRFKTSSWKKTYYGFLDGLPNQERNQMLRKLESGVPPEALAAIQKLYHDHYRGGLDAGDIRVFRQWFKTAKLHPESVVKNERFFQQFLPNLMIPPSHEFFKPDEYFEMIDGMRVFLNPKSNHGLPPRFAAEALERAEKEIRSSAEDLLANSLKQNFEQSIPWLKRIAKESGPDFFMRSRWRVEKKDVEESVRKRYQALVQEEVDRVIKLPLHDSTRTQLTKTLIESSLQEKKLSSNSVSMIKSLDPTLLPIIKELSTEERTMVGQAEKYLKLMKELKINGVPSRTYLSETVWQKISKDLMRDKNDYAEFTHYQDAILAALETPIERTYPDYGKLLEVYAGQLRVFSKENRFKFPTAETIRKNQIERLVENATRDHRELKGLPESFWKSIELVVTTPEERMRLALALHIGGAGNDEIPKELTSGEPVERFLGKQVKDWSSVPIEGEDPLLNLSAGESKALKKWVAQTTFSDLDPAHRNSFNLRLDAHIQNPMRLSEDYLTPKELKSFQAKWNNASAETLAENANHLKTMKPGERKLFLESLNREANKLVNLPKDDPARDRLLEKLIKNYHASKESYDAVHPLLAKMEPSLLPLMNEYDYQNGKFVNFDKWGEIKFTREMDQVLLDGSATKQKLLDTVWGKITGEIGGNDSIQKYDFVRKALIEGLQKPLRYSHSGYAQMMYNYVQNYDLILKKEGNSSVFRNSVPKPEVILERQFREFSEELMRNPDFLKGVNSGFWESISKTFPAPEKRLQILGILRNSGVPYDRLPPQLKNADFTEEMVEARRTYSLAKNRARESTEDFLKRISNESTGKLIAGVEELEGLSAEEKKVYLKLLKERMEGIKALPRVHPDREAGRFHPN